MALRVDRKGRVRPARGWNAVVEHANRLKRFGPWVTRTMAQREGKRLAKEIGGKYVGTVPARPDY